MEKITDKIAALPPDGNYFSLEFFPPKTLMGSANLQARLERMAQALRPLFVTVTWGAGGTTAARSLELAEICQRQLQLTTCLHLTCTNMSRALIDEALEEAKVLGIRNILALRGDPPRSEEYNMDGEDDSNRDFAWAVDLVRYIRRVYGDYFCIGVAAYPEGYAADSLHQQHQQHQQKQREQLDLDEDVRFLADKVRAGADFIMTQLTYDAAAYLQFERRLRRDESGIFSTIPIIPGLMPIHSYKILTRVTKLSHARIPPPIMRRIEDVKADDDAVKRAGVDILSEIVLAIKSEPSQGPRGFHFYTLNLEKSVSFVLERCHLIPESADDDDNNDNSDDNDGDWRQRRRRRASSINSQPHNRVIVDRLQVVVSPACSSSAHNESTSHEALATSAGMPALPPSRSTTLQISEGLGSLGREATWDDFPNGRWGDARSPAFGEIDGYGPSLHVAASVGRRLWGYPVTRADISTLFRRHVSGELYIVPWSEGGADDEPSSNGNGNGNGSSSSLNAETAVIRPQLLKLIDGRGWWTLASQPAVNGVRSDHPVFGWGPPGEGFVFQKPFVEFFCPHEDFVSILRPIFQRHGHDELCWFATNSAGHFESSVSLQRDHSNSSVSPARHDDVDMDVDNDRINASVNAVTWGVFRGKEIVTPTIIEEVSFRAWGEEAYRIWDEWRRIYARGSPTERLLDSLKSDVWLVCVIGQDYGAGLDAGSSQEMDTAMWMWRVLAGEVD